MHRRALPLVVTGLLGLGGALWLLLSPGLDVPTTSSDAPAKAPVAPAPPPSLAVPATPSTKARELAMGEVTPAGTLVVHVTQVGGKAIVGALVYAWHGNDYWPGETDAMGEVRLTEITAETVTVRASAEGFSGEETEDVETLGTERPVLQFELTTGVAFDGVVVDVRNASPIGDARVTVAAHGSVGGFFSSSGRVAYDRTHTDEKGRFHVRGVPEGQVATVEVMATDYAEGALSVRILGGAVTPSPVVVQLTPGGRVVGVVRDPNGTPLAGATVYVMPASSSAAMRGTPRALRRLFRS